MQLSAWSQSFGKCQVAMIMADVFTKSERSALMARIRGKDTKPELLVRRLIHGLGYRYRLHRKELPGTPDLVFPSRKKVIFVHGCFWHRHEGCKFSTMPKTRVDFWKKKFESNVRRDSRVQEELALLGWRSMVVWECETKSLETLTEKIHRFLCCQDNMI